MVRDVVGALGVHDLSQRLPHVYIAVPRIWDRQLPIDEGPPPITLAQVIPVSEAEYDLWKAAPLDFEITLAAREVDVMDLRRA